MEKIDPKKNLGALYNPPSKAFTAIDVPALQFVKVDGAGDPNTAPTYRLAVECLFGVSYSMKFIAKAALGRDYVVPPLEGLWWADDPDSFLKRQKDAWFWTMMIMVPDFVGRDIFLEAFAKIVKKSGAPPPSLRLERYVEGASLQILHRGSYDDEGPILAQLHEAVMPGKGLTFNGPHHEIYLSDPRRTAPAKLKTILRQPVKPIG